MYIVSDKKVFVSASNARGAIVLFRSIQHLDLDDDATAFIIGREMGHVIARHHKSNAKTKIFFTVLTAVLFPAASLISASSAAAQATTATTLMTSAASTVTSFVGSEVALSRIKPNQLSEADDISIALLEFGGVTKADTARSLEFIAENENSVGWEKDLNLSIQNVRKLAGESIKVVAELEPLPDAYAAIEADFVAPEASVAKPEQKQVEQNPIQVEQTPTEQKSVQLKTVEQHKVILITNQTLAESRNIKNIIPVKGKLGITNNLNKDTSTAEKTKKDLTKKIATKNTRAKNVKPKKVEIKKSGKLAAKKSSTQGVKKSGKVSTRKAFKKTDLAKK